LLYRCQGVCRSRRDHQKLFLMLDFAPKWDAAWRARYLFLQHGGKVVLVAQFVPILRTIAGILAGVNIMPWRRFVITNVLGACIWAASYGYAAYTFGHQFRRLEAPAMVVLGIITTAIIIFGIVFIRRHEAQLVAKAQAALPGPLDVPHRSHRSAK